MTPQQLRQLQQTYMIPEPEQPGFFSSVGNRLAQIPAQAPLAWKGLTGMFSGAPPNRPPGEPPPELQNSHGGSTVTGWINSIPSGFGLARDVSQGKVDPNSDEFIQRQLDMIGLMAPGGMGGAGAGGTALGSGPVRKMVGPGGINLDDAVARAEQRSLERAAPANAPTNPLDATPVGEGRYRWALPQFADRYPQGGQWEWTNRPKGDKRGGQYMGKAQTDEEKLLMGNRAKVIEDMRNEEWTPYYDPEKRADVDPAFYPRPHDTMVEATAAKVPTREKYYAMANTPEAKERLRAAYEHGSTLPGAENWYYMKQLEDSFIKQYGPEEGRKQFQQKFAGAMASTTSAMSPTNNLMAAHYGNYLRTHGKEFPQNSYDVPSPLGGPQTKGNLDEYQKTFVGPNAPMTTKSVKKNPKRYDFEWDFLGHKNPVVDKQMSQLFDPKLTQPGDYAQYGRVLGELAQEYGVDPRRFQEVAWGGQKNLKTRKGPLRDPNVRWNSPDYGEGGFQPTPMISIVNEAIERTSRLTGRSPEDVVRLGLIRSEIPMYQRGLPLPALYGNDEERRR